MGSPVHVTATAKSPVARITAMRIYVDKVSRYLVRASSINTSLPLPAGKHLIVVQAWDARGTVFKTPVTITVH